MKKKSIEKLLELSNNRLICFNRELYQLKTEWITIGNGYQKFLEKEIFELNNCITDLKNIILKRKCIKHDRLQIKKFK